MLEGEFDNNHTVIRHKVKLERISNIYTEFVEPHTISNGVSATQRAAGVIEPCKNYTYCEENYT